MATDSTTLRKPSGAKLNRSDKARAIFERGHVHPAPNGGTYHWLVDSESGAGQYRVHRYQVEDRDRFACTCPDYRRHAEAGELDHSCKHIQSVWLFQRACRAGFRAVA